MTYDLYIGDRTFSSWSLRGWLMLKSFGIPVKSHFLGLYSGTLETDLAPFAPARQVPILKTSQGHMVFDTLAMAETLAEAHPMAGLWPEDPAQRGAARSLVAQMHSGFSALREHCPMNLQNAWEGFEVSDNLHADLAYLETLWRYAFKMSGDQDWLFGAYSLADVFFAPVAARIACYKLPVSQQAQQYVNKHLAHQDFRQWRAMGLTKHYDPFPYDMACTSVPWPGPRTMVAEVAQGPSENKTCPYSGDAVTDFLRIDSRVFGFCNPFCRDKTLADPAAWPEFMALYLTAKS